MRRRPGVATLDNVTIVRDGETAIISFNDGRAGVNLTIGPEIDAMRDEDIINLHNEILRSQKQMAKDWRPTEIIEGHPQIKFDRKMKAWSAEGHVLRCLVEGGPNHNEPAIQIDGHELSLQEFGTILSHFEGWGMRIAFVSDDELCNPPQPELRKAPQRLSKEALDKLTEECSDKPAEIAEITIEMIASQFTHDKHTKSKIQDEDRVGVTKLFLECMNGYGHEFLSKKETSLFDHYYNLEGQEHREFCQLFGAIKILDNVYPFVGSYLIRKIMLDEEDLETAALVIAEFCAWLGKQGFVRRGDAKHAAERAKRAAVELPRAEEANRLIYAEMKKCPRTRDGCIDLDYLTVKRIDNNDDIWFEYEGKEVGPVCATRRIAQLLELNWTVCCALAKSGKHWYFAEVGNVYPA